MEHTSLSARIWKEQLKIIEKAADALGTKLGEYISVGEYVRRKIMPHAFEDAGIKPREFPSFTRGKPTVAGQVAAKLGMPRKVLEKAWIDRMATLALKDLTEDPEEEEEPDKRRSSSDFRALTPPPGVEVIRKRQTR